MCGMFIVNVDDALLASLLMKYQRKIGSLIAEQPKSFE